ncbi:LysR family transcriptional regulator [Pseudosulfitobacter sp. DSM 107133]|uniref:LysR family transcriptional regulator n=1 Tax=Pseudosulfitobacter sp. DSM 107133 TaxID=2883100 RepID=UPI000DF4A698|nr:LysR family transcriptional regulator [Pseudosulfitobacter sp. DSM 107133]UOA28430.1 HTH-type transcriptional activator CmpR [Pseudosulfitobacter sp. DSM 107133]
MDNWDEIKTAYQVARMGTVSGAAEVLGVHHATVIRHIDALETRLGVKLFQRHARGYTATEAGDDLFRVAKATDDQFSQLAGRIKGRGADVSGDLVITSLTSLVPRMVPILADFQRENPDVIIRYLTGARLFRLEYGEAHVAIRAGSPPSQPDNVVQSLSHQRMGLYASRRYVDTHGLPKDWDACSGHRFVGTNNDQSRAPFNRWLREKVPDIVFGFRSDEDRAIEQAIINGAGIGFATVLEARANPDLVEVFPQEEGWSAPLWLVTHVDLHRTTKVQSFLTFIKDAAKGWDA